MESKRPTKNNKYSERDKLVIKIQKSLDDTRLLLLRVKSKSGITEPTKGDISDAIETLEEIIRQLPDISKSPTLLDVMSSLIKKTYDIWQQMCCD